MQRNFRCVCGVMVITTDPYRNRCRTCEPKVEEQKYKGTVVLRPPKKENPDDSKN